MKKTLLIYPTIFIVTALICMLFLLGVAAVPQAMIEENARQSAGYFYGQELFEMSMGEWMNFQKDNYADCISVGIAYHLGNGDNLWKGIISADYNRVADENVNVSFYRAMNGAEVETESYARYWHGNAAVIRLLLICMNIQTIRWVIMVAGVLFNIGVVWTLCRRNYKILGSLYGVAFLLVNGVFALTCMEYAFIFLLMPLAVMFLLNHKSMADMRNVIAAFLVVGMLTAYFDFLTAETLTFTVPFTVYYIVVWKSEQNKSRKDHHKTDLLLLLRTGCAWCAGYAGMFFLKWLLAWVTLGKEAIATATDSALERIAGDVTLTADVTGQKATFLQRLGGIWQRNVGCLYWGSQDMKPVTVIIITAVIVIVLGTFWYMTRKTKMNYDKAGVLCLVALIPYVRFLFLSNHAYIHYFFTYRAQMVSVMILLYLVYKTTILSEIKKGKKK